MSRPTWSPLGAARAAVNGPSSLDAATFPPALVTCARAADLGEERLHLAWELARLARPAAAGDAQVEASDAFRGLVALLLVVFDAMSRGSTRVPLGRDARDGLRAHAEALGLDAPDVARVLRAADAILDAAGTGFGLQRGLALDDAPLELARIVGPPGAFVPFVLRGSALAPQRLDALEARLASMLARRAAGPSSPSSAVAPAVPTSVVDAAVASVLAAPAIGRRGPVVLTDEQTAAVRLSLSAPVAVISGGPGTGKTSIVVSMLRALVRIDPTATVALAAPTGKAADRMARAIEAGLVGCDEPADGALRARLPQASTLHRLLGWSPSEERFRHHEGSPLAERVVIVDEASMIDLVLMERLVAALHPDARLVLLGDADQLPSVDPGAVLADLVASSGRGAIGVVRLTQSHRMDPSDPAGSHILGVARRVRDGVAPELVAAPAAGPAPEGALGRRRALPDDGVPPPGVSLVPAADAAALERVLSWWWTHRVAPADPSALDRTYRLDEPGDVARLGPLFDRLDASRLLCATRGRATGTDAVNAWMAARAARARGQRLGPLFLAGEPLMVVRNDHDAGLFNGDQGLVLWIAGADGAPQPCLVVRRGEGFEAHRIERVRARVERAYATTVHKAQGSEHDCVGLVLPDEDVPRLLTREILYTALTRARTSVVVAGPGPVLLRAVARRAARDTGLSALLAAP